MSVPSNAERPAFPLQRGEVLGAHDGLTKRELFAAMAMQGVLSNRVYEPPRRTKIAGMAKDAVSAADALLAELAKDGES